MKTSTDIEMVSVNTESVISIELVRDVMKRTKYGIVYTDAYILATLQQ